MTYKLSVWYAATPEGEPPQTFDLSADQVQQYVRPDVGFLNDLLSLEGQGVRRLCLEAEAEG